MDIPDPSPTAPTANEALPGASAAPRTGASSSTTVVRLQPFALTNFFLPTLLQAWGYLVVYLMRVGKASSLITSGAVDADADYLVHYARSVVKAAQNTLPAWVMMPPTSRRSGAAGSGGGGQHTHSLSGGELVLDTQAVDAAATSAQRLQILLNSGASADDLKQLAWTFGEEEEDVVESGLSVAGAAGVPPAGPPSSGGLALPTSGAARSSSSAREKFRRAASGLTKKDSSARRVSSPRGAGAPGPGRSEEGFRTGDPRGRRDTHQGGGGSSGADDVSVSSGSMQTGAERRNTNVVPVFDEEGGLKKKKGLMSMFKKKKKHKDPRADDRDELG